MALRSYRPLFRSTRKDDGTGSRTWPVGTVVIVGALTYFPALSLGQIVEHFQMLNGKVF
jgi:potassium-transporting ATPase potassium-binding subunit